MTSTMPEQVDVLIIGGGPAGLATGIVFGRQGLRTLVCEQKRLPVDKICGEGIMPTGVAHLAQLGVTRYLGQGDFFPFHGVRYHSAGGRCVTGLFSQGPGWGIRRPILACGLLQRTSEVGVEVWDEVCARPQERLDGRIAVAVGKEVILTRLLVGADGLNSRVRRWAGLQGPPPAWQRWGARQHFAVTPWSNCIEVYWGRGAEAYVTPCSTREVSIAFLWERGRFTGIAGGRALIPSLLAEFPALQERLKGASPCDAPRAVGPLQRRVHSPVADGVALVGDAAGYLDAITGEGISLATAAAMALARTVAPLLHDDSRQAPTARDLAAYERAYQAIVRPYYQVTAFVLFLSRHHTLVERMVQTLARQPTMLQHLLSANMGLAPLWPGVMKGARLLWGVLAAGR